MLASALDAALGGRGGAFVIAGEPGIGKTRLAEAIASAGSDRGARVLRGRCWEGGGAPAFWPYVPIFRALLAQALADRDERSSRRIEGILAAWEASGERPAGVLPAALDPTTEVFARLHEMASLLAPPGSASARVLLLDDLHAADRSSLWLTRFVVRDVRDKRLLVLATHREDEDRDHGGAAPLLDALGVEATKLTLGPLSAAETDELVLRRLPGASAGARRRIAEAAGGNPFFVGELTRLVSSAGGRPSVAAEFGGSASGIVRRRIEHLPAEAASVLSTAALLGHEFDVAVLQECAGAFPERVLDALHAAEVAGIVRPLEGGRRFVFRHGLFREGLLATLAAVDRAHRHRRIGAALERVHADRLDAHASELANHFVEAARDGGDLGPAVDHSRRAGRYASSLLAYEEAARHFERAFSSLEVAPRRDVALETELQVEIGEAWARAGRTEQARSAFARAAELARGLPSRDGDRRGDLLARAALGLGGVWLVTGTGVVDRPLVARLEEALEAIRPDQQVLRARLAARRASALRDSPIADERQLARSLGEEALSLARRSGDATTLVHALIARLWSIWEPATAPTRAELGAEIVRVGLQYRDRVAMLVGQTWRASALLELGRAAEFLEAAETAIELADDLRQPFYRWWALGLRTLRALLEGRLDAAEPLVFEELELGQQVEAPDAFASFGIQLAVLRMEQGRLEEVEGGLRAFVEQYPDMPGWRCALAGLYREIRDREAERVEFERVASRGFESIPRDAGWLGAIVSLAEVAADLGDRRRCDELYGLLLPFAERNVVVGAATVCFGPVARALGILASALGRHADAERHFETALARAAAVGARSWLARTELAYAQSLVARATSGDRERAGELLGAVRRVASELGMKSLAAAADALDVCDAAGRGEPVFRLEGDYWTIRLEGDEARVRDGRGVRCLELLARHPGREISALELAGSFAAAPPRRGPPAGKALRAGGLDRPGEILDRRARSEYRRRVAELRAELAAAPSDPAAAVWRAEIEVLQRELSAAEGFGGRSRRFPSSAERARVNLTKSIRAAVARIAEANPRLGGHFEESIRTGACFSYRPAAPGAH